MIYPGNLIGPKFEDGDLLTFIFDGAELTFRALSLTENSNAIDDTCPINNFCGISTESWRTNDNNQAEILLLLQHWTVEDSESLDDIAACKFYVKLIEISPAPDSGNHLLSYATFEQLMVDWHTQNFTQNDNMYADSLDHPTAANRYQGKSLSKPHLDWFIVQLPLNARLKPIQLLMIPISNRFVLMAYLKIESLHYAGRTNPYSNEVLKQFERDLFDDFLSHIKIEYSPETIATINSLKVVNPLKATTPA